MQPLNHPFQKPEVSPPIRDNLGMPPDCCPKILSKFCSPCSKFIPKRFQQRWTFLRSKAHRLVEHRFFEWLIIGSILASSTTLVSDKNKSKLF